MWYRGNELNISMGTTNKNKKFTDKKGISFHLL